MKVRKTVPDWVIGLLITFVFLFITFTGRLDFTNAVEMKTFDVRARIAASGERNPDIELVVINDNDLSELGRLPWPRDILAKAIRNLSLAGARVIALNILFPEPEESAGLKTVRQLKEDFEKLDLAQEDPGLSFLKSLSQSVTELDNDAKLYNAMKEAGNVVLPIYFDVAASGRDTQVPDFIAGSSFKHIRGAKDEYHVRNLIWVSKMTPMLASFAEVAAGVGHINLFPDEDGSLRSQVHVLGYLKDIYFPSFTISIVKAFKGLKDGDITVSLGKGIYFRNSPSSVSKVPVIDGQMSTLIDWNTGPRVAFHQTRFSKVYKNEIQTSLFRDKIVVIGPTAPGIGDRFVTPISGHLPGVEVIANSVANILDQRFLSRPGWIPLTELGLLLVFGLFISFALPRMNVGTGAVATLVLFLSLGAAGTVLFFNYHIWLKITPSMLLIVIGYILIIPKRFFITEKNKERMEADSVETDKMLGLSFQQQGMFDLALEKFSKLPMEEQGVKDLLYNLGRDFERKRQFSKALATYKLIMEDGGKFKDLGDRLPRLKGAEAAVIFGSDGGGNPGDTGSTLVGVDTKPTLGRYEVVGELGRGAMGVVYKGVDPKIHRTVAIKTVRLSDFDEEVVDEMKERFFREAESAGVLTHPNIVTIYDCGEEHDLAYIAMEYLEGENLEGFARQDAIMPVRESLFTVYRVAQALDFAHSKGIVHRDIKPANIMRMKDTREVKVTDFGIARIASSSKTKTGIILGTPSYMSPEQIAGQKVDGRSDIFSLGVVLFELITGHKPFSGDDMASLMYKILRERHPSARSINPMVPQVVEKIIDRALAKEKEKRYQRAGQMAEHLRRVVAQIDEIRAKKASQKKAL